MRVLLSGICVLAAGVLMAVSSIFNYAFMASFARSEHEALFLGAAAVAGDLIKACLPFFIVLAWRGRRYVFAAVGSIVFGFLTLVSLVASLGYTADVRGSTAQARSALSAELRQAEHALARITATRSATGSMRAPAVVTEEIARLRQDRLWESSNECTDATTAASRTYCARYFALRSEFASAAEAARIEASERDLLAKVEKLRASGAGQEAEPQVAMLVNLTGNRATAVRTALILAAAIFIEVGSGLGLYLALQHSSPTRWCPTRGNDAMRDGTTTTWKHAVPANGFSQLAVEARHSIYIEQIERYGVARLQPAQNGRTSIMQIFADYQQWSAQHNVAVMMRADFVDLLDDLVRDIGIARCGDDYVGIALGDGPPTARPIGHPTALRALAPATS